MRPISRRALLRTSTAGVGAMIMVGTPEARVEGPIDASARADRGRPRLSFPSTALTRRARKLVEQHEPPLVLNHSLRSYLFAKATAGQGGLRQGRDYNDELLFLICVLHDIGLTDVANGDQRFEVDSADFAARFLERNGARSDWVDTAWDAIALHTSSTLVASPVFSRRRPPEINIAITGIGADILGGPQLLPPGFADQVHALYPRHGGARALTEVMVAQAAANPGKAPPLTFPGEVLHQRMPSAPYTTWDMLLDAAGWGD